MIVDPFGSIVAQCSDMQPYQPSFCLAEIVSPHTSEQEEGGVAETTPQDLEAMAEMRTEMPLWSQRRTDVYPEV